ncbi:serine-type peptidase [Niveomyces insectorum RCEF 264]|uniref:Serine-type peptidase n=1 Tax=Niveomyces insectorum RCEF 264 TaxID=1081102 RepID=A0A167SF94_9HYPO|nr:serine-type peptidase [Niveomyces insectorum RCEF 264]
MRCASVIATLVVAGASAVSAGVLGRNNMKPPPLLADPDLEWPEVSVPSPPRNQLRGTTSLWDHSSSSSSSAVPVRGLATFQQQVDHSDPSQGTFSQRYWYSTEYWTGPGAPVVFFTPGESAADLYTGYLTNRTLTGQFAQALGAAVVMLEHRYWGGSSPFANLTTKNLRFLTLANAVADTTNFARRVQLPFDNLGTGDGSSSSTTTTTTSNAPDVPWVMSGGSYSGALAAWVQHMDAGTYWAYHASSAVVQTIGDFWQYFVPVQQGMPQNCSADVQRVVAHVDAVLATGTDADVQALKTAFGLGSVEHNDDFAAALVAGPASWQDHDFDTDYSTFFQFCDYVENAFPGSNVTTVPGPDGVGLDKALAGYAKWYTEVAFPGACASLGYYTDNYTTACFDSYNASSPYYTDTRVDNTIDRQWEWLLCNEPFEFWQDGAPAGTPTLVSRLVSADYAQRQCALYFPPEDGYTYGAAQGRTPADVNAVTGGWSAAAAGNNNTTTRLVWTNGEFDPWRDATVSSTFRPGGPLASTPAAPVNLIPGGIHCSDLIYANALVNAGVMAVVRDEIAVIKGWVDEFYAAKTPSSSSA